MTDEGAQGRALRPLWSTSGGAVVAATAAWWVRVPCPHWAQTALVLLGAAALVAALVRISHRRGASSTVLWFAAGLALVGGRGLGAAVDRLSWESLVASPGTAVRARVVVTEGWTESRWGRRSRVSVLDAEIRDHPIGLPHRSRIEIRGATVHSDIPVSYTHLTLPTTPYV